MKSYEGMFLFKPDLSKESLDKVVGQVQEIIGKNKGSLDQVNDWGKKKLAYPIKKYDESFYYLINFHAEPGGISKIKEAVNLNESILRTLIVAG